MKKSSVKIEERGGVLVWIIDGSYLRRLTELEIYLYNGKKDYD